MGRGGRQKGDLTADKRRWTRICKGKRMGGGNCRCGGGRILAVGGTSGGRFLAPRGQPQRGRHFSAQAGARRRPGLARPPAPSPVWATQGLSSTLRMVAPRQGFGQSCHDNPGRCSGLKNVAHLGLCPLGLGIIPLRSGQRMRPRRAYVSPSHSPSDMSSKCWGISR